MTPEELEEKARQKREAMVSFSSAIRETIRTYGITATLDLVVRISNHDPIVSELLPYFSTIARAATLEARSKRTLSEVEGTNPGDPATERERLILLAK